MKKKWSIENIKIEIDKVMDVHGLDEFPSRQFLEGIGRSDIFNAIGRNGGFGKISKELGIPLRSEKRRGKWTLTEIESELKTFISKHSYTVMPSKSEFIKLGRQDLGNALTRYKNMRYWANKIGLELKDSETKKGQDYERRIIFKLQSEGYEVENMTTKHPYDILVNNSVKIDTKVGMPHYHFGTRAHTFATNKKYPTCDIYICIALNEDGEIENIYIIPSKFAQIITLNICGNSKYNAFINRWDYIKRYADFYETVKDVLPVKT